MAEVEKITNETIKIGLTEDDEIRVAFPNDIPRLRVRGKDELAVLSFLSTDGIEGASLVLTADELYRLAMGRAGEHVSIEELGQRERNETATVLDEVCEERRRQDEKWGGPAHDDAHDLITWASFVEARAGQIKREELPEVRRLFVEIAAIAAAAVESIDRRAE